MQPKPICAEVIPPLTLSAPVLANEKNRHGSVAHDVLRVASHHDPAQSPAPVSAAYDEIRRPLLRGLDHDLTGRVAHGLYELCFDCHSALTCDDFSMCQ